MDVDAQRGLLVGMEPASEAPAGRTRLRVQVFKDPWSAWTHFLGGWVALFGAVYIVMAARGNDARFLSMSIYGVTLVALFGASSVYHFFDIGERGNRWLRRVDHAAIFAVIAGTYVPALTYLLDGSWRIGMFWGVGLFALLGIIFKTFWIDCPAWLGTTIYVAMACMALVPGSRMLGAMEPAQALWLGVGCIAYFLGALVFVRRWPDPWPETFGFHEVWHLFVLAGAGAHYGFMLTLIERAPPAF